MDVTRIVTKPVEVAVRIELTPDEAKAVSSACHEVGRVDAPRYLADEDKKVLFRLYAALQGRWATPVIEVEDE